MLWPDPLSYLWCCSIYLTCPYNSILYRESQKNKCLLLMIGEKIKRKDRGYIKLVQEFISSLVTNLIIWFIQNGPLGWTKKINLTGISVHSCIQFIKVSCAMQDRFDSRPWKRKIYLTIQIRNNVTATKSPRQTYNSTCRADGTVTEVSTILVNYLIKKKFIEET